MVPYLVPHHVASAAKILESAKRNPENVRFADLEKLVEAGGYKLARQKGSHRSFTAPGMPFVTLQPAKGGKAKTYQV